MKTLGNFIGNQHVASNSAGSAAVYNSATGKQTLSVSLATANETRSAVASAKTALPGWSKTTPLNRARILFKFKALLETHSDEIATMISQEHGKVFSDAKGELTRGIEVVEFACGIPHLLKGEHSLNVGSGVDSSTLMQPVGVCAGITPFNFPAMVPMWMFPVPMPFHSFGGWKRSLFGPLHMHGPDGVRFFTKMKTITTRWLSGRLAGSAAEFSMPTMT